jgi:polyisoprenoid-binding protein YceI
LLALAWVKTGASGLTVDIVKRLRQLSPGMQNREILKMRTTLLALVGAAGLSLAAVGTIHAQGAPQPGAIDVAAIEDGNYTADAGHSMVQWKLSHLGFNDYYGIFGDVAGTLTVNKANPSASKVDVTIPITSVTVPSAGLRDHLLRPGQNGGAPDFFGANPAPARFVSTSVEPTGETSANITGNLTLNGVTKPVTIEAELAGMGTNGMSQKKTLGFHGTTTIKRSEFNIPFGIPVGLSDEVDLTITIAFEK